MKLRKCASMGALAVAPLCMHAQSLAANGDSVQLYGVVGAGIASDTVTYQGQRWSRVAPRSELSLYGLKGEHALANGFVLDFELVNGFTFLTGQGSGDRIWARESRLGLAHPKMGRVDVGRHYNTTAYWSGATDPLGGSYDLGGFDTVMMTGTRRDNMILYRTPTMDGWQAGIGWSFDINSLTTAERNKKIAEKLPPGESPKTFSSRNGQRHFDIGVRYFKGPIKFVATYDRAMRRATDPDYRHQKTIHGYFLGAAYDFEPLEIYGQFGQQFGGMMSTKGLRYTPNIGDKRMRDYRYSRGARYDSVMLGAAINSGPHRYMASWQNMNTMGTTTTGDTAQMHVFSVAYRHTLSKRTELRAYAYVARNYGFVRSLHARTASVGVRHRF